MGVKVSIIGAGSTYCPELAQGLIAARNLLPVDSVYLMDINERKLNIVGGFFKRFFAQQQMPADVCLTTDLHTAIEHADFVITQIRVGEMPARIRDEKIPLKYGLIGQETTGIGGMMNALRALPAIETIAREIEQSAPDAWLINFANPSGILTEYLANHTKVHSIGLCNVPITMLETLSRILDIPLSSLRLDSVGLNHLSWYTGVFDENGNEWLGKLLDSHFQGVSMQNIEAIEALPDMMQTLHAIPSSYLNYFFYRDQELQKLKTVDMTRGERCQLIENELLEYYGNPENTDIPALLAKRGGHLYSQAAIELITSLYTGDGKTHVINVRNEGVLDFLDDSDVIETTCHVTKNGYQRIPLSSRIPSSAKGLIQAVKQYEKLTVQAGIHGDRQAALEALLCHPLIGDATLGKAAFEELLEAHRPLLPRFFES